MQGGVYDTSMPGCEGTEGPLASHKRLEGHRDTPTMHHRGTYWYHSLVSMQYRDIGYLFQFREMSFTSLNGMQGHSGAWHKPPLHGRCHSLVSMGCRDIQVLFTRRQMCCSYLLPKATGNTTSALYEHNQCALSTRPVQYVNTTSELYAHDRTVK